MQRNGPTGHLAVENDNVPFGLDSPLIKYLLDMNTWQYFFLSLDADIDLFSPSRVVTLKCLQASNTSLSLQDEAREFISHSTIP